MPAPAIYVIAIIGTVGAVIAFKEFVYDPHLGPAIGRWKRELLAAREERKRRRAALLDEDGGPGDAQGLPMKERKGLSLLETDDASHGDNSPEQFVLGSQHAKHPFSRDGLLIGRPGSIESISPETQSSIELDHLVARELKEWRNEVITSSGQDLRQRKGGFGHGAMDEPIHSITYQPLCSKPTHVLINSGSASPASPANAIQPLATPTQPSMVSKSVTTRKPQLPLPSPPSTLASSSRSRSPSFSGSITSSNSPLPTSSSKVQPEPQIQTLPLLDLSPSQHPLPPQALSPQLQSSPYSSYIPSLSQSYPQELEAEHGLEFLSPPSSRADSPFSMADASPGPRSLGRIVDFRDRPPSILSTGFIQNDSLSPLASLGMDLGNESFDTLSPLLGHLDTVPNLQATTPNVSSGSSLQQHTSSTATSASANASPFLHLSSEPLRLPTVASSHSVANSARSTTYLSFTGDDDDDDDDVPLAVRRASLSSAGSISQSQGLGLTFISPSTINVPAVRSPPRSLNYNESDISDLDLMSDYAPSDAGLVSIESLSESECGGNDEVGIGDGNRSRVLHSLATGYESDGSESNASWSIAGESDVSGTG